MRVSGSARAVDWFWRCQNGSDLILNLDEIRQPHLSSLLRFHYPPKVLHQDRLPLPDDKFRKGDSHFSISLFVAMPKGLEILGSVLAQE